MRDVQLTVLIEITMNIYWEIEDIDADNAIQSAGNR